MGKLQVRPSQAGYFIGATTRSIISGAECKISTLVWESAKVKRVGLPTLVAEAMAMTKCMAETTFAQVLWNEMSDAIFDLHRWLDGHLEADSG